MGAAAIPLMIASTVVSTAGSVYQAQQTSNANEARGRQAGRQAKAEEIKRLQKYRQATAHNIMATANSGTAFSGSPMSVIDAERTVAEEDIAIVQAEGKASQSLYQQAAKAATTGGIFSAASGALSAASMGVQGYTDYKNTAKPQVSGSKPA